MRSMLITGASHGVGRALALAAAASGDYDKLILTCRRDLPALSETARLVSDAGVLCAVSQGDVGNLAYIRSLRAKHGPVHTLVNNAAVSWVGLLTEMPPEAWDDLIRTNITSLYHTCSTYVPDMVRNQSGTILNISSVWGETGASCEVAYSASKGAVNAFTRALARELAPSHIQVNAVALGIIGTRMNSRLTPEETENIRQEIPAGYIASPEEAARGILNLLQMPEYFNGQVVRLDGCWQ